MLRKSFHASQASKQQKIFWEIREAEEFSSRIFSKEEWSFPSSKWHNFSYFSQPRLSIAFWRIIFLWFWENEEEQQLKNLSNTSVCNVKCQVKQTINSGLQDYTTKKLPCSTITHQVFKTTFCQLLIFH